MKLLVNEKHVNWDKLLDRFEPKIDYKDESKLIEKNDESFYKEYFDAYIFDLSDDYKYNLKHLEKLKKYNPDLKTIVFTSEANRKYRSMMLFKDVDMFLFRETDFDLLQNIIKRIHLRKTKL